MSNQIGDEVKESIKMVAAGDVAKAKRQTAFRKVALILVAAGILVAGQAYEHRKEAARNQVSRESYEAAERADALGGRPGTVLEMTAGSTTRKVILPTSDVEAIKAVRDQVRSEYEGASKTPASSTRGDQ